MKTYLTYGFYMAFGSALIVFALYFLGFHSEAAKIDLAGKIQMGVGLAVSITCIVVGTKERRAELSAAENFSYSSALAAGFMIVLFASLFSAVFNYLYSTVINPGFIEIMLQAQSGKLEAQGLSAEKVEQINGFTRKMMQPAIQAGLGLLGGLFFGTLLSLITAAFLKRTAHEELVAS